MKLLAYILWFIAAILFIWEQIKDKPGKRQTVRQKLIRWRMRIIAAIIAALAVGIHQYPQDPEIPSDNWDELTCDIDTVKSLLQQSLDSQNEEYLEAARKEAACIDASEFARTANDSGIVALGLAKYPEAIIHFQYAIWAAEDDLSRGEAYANMALTQLLWGESLSTEDDQDNRHHHLNHAVIYYDSALVYKHDDSNAWYNRGYALGRLGEFTAAMASYDSALVCKYDDAEAWNNRGVALAKLGDFTAAVASCDSALVYKHDDSHAWCNRGSALNDLGDFTAAVASYDSALVYKYYFAEAWCNRGNTLANLGEFSAAVASYDSALVYKNDDAMVWHNRSCAQYNLGEFTAAMASCDSALRYKRDYAEAWCNRGVALRHLGEFTAATASCDSALKYDPDLIEARELKKTIQEELE